MSDYLDSSDYTADIFASTNSSQQTPSTDPSSYGELDDAFHTFPTTPKLAPTAHPNHLETIDPRVLDKSSRYSQQPIDFVGEHFTNQQPSGGAPSPSPNGDLLPLDVADALGELQHGQMPYRAEQPWFPRQEYDLRACHKSAAKGSTSRIEVANEYGYLSQHMDRPALALEQLSMPPATGRSYADALASNLTGGMHPQIPLGPAKMPIPRAIASTNRAGFNAQTVTLTCESCGSTFDRVDTYRRHSNTKHHASKVLYFCSLHGCSFDHRRKDKVMLHCREVHGQAFGEEKVGEGTGVPVTPTRSRGPNKPKKGNGN